MEKDTKIAVVISSATLLFVIVVFCASIYASQKKYDFLIECSKHAKVSECAISLK